VPDSDRAPHQVKHSGIYYVRISGKSHPAPHWLLEDIRNRQRHPEIAVELKLLGVELNPNVGVGSHPIRLSLDVTISNGGKVKATNACIRVDSNEPSFGLNLITYEHFSIRRGSPAGSTLLELQHPVYPGMEFSVPMRANLQAIFRAHDPALDALYFLSGIPKRLADLELGIIAFADSAPPRIMTETGASLDLENATETAIMRLHMRAGANVWSAALSQAKSKGGGLVCANVFGLYWSGLLRP